MASSYPTSLDSLSTTHADNAGEVVHAATVNDLADAVNKIETELGTLPKGSYADVKTAIAGQVPKSTVTATGDLIVGTGNATVGRLGVGASTTVLHGGTTPGYSQIVNADVDPAAAIAYSKLNLASSIVNADVSASAAIAISKLADPTTGKVIGSSASAAAAVFPPGYEIGYTEVTTNQTSTATTAATATSIISAGAITFDGTAVICEFFCPFVSHSLANSSIALDLYDSSTDLGILGQVISANAASTGEPTLLHRKFTPSAGSHTYSVRMWTPSGAGTATAQAGAGGAGTFFPMYIRFTKV